MIKNSSNDYYFMSLEEKEAQNKLKQNPSDNQDKLSKNNYYKKKEPVQY